MKGKAGGQCKNNLDFQENFRVNVTSFFFLHFSPVSLTESYSFWYGLKDLFTLHKLADKVVLVC